MLEHVQGVIKIEITDIEASTVQETLMGPESKKCITSADLPLSQHYRYLWKTRFVPDIIYFISNHLCPWNTAGINWVDFFISTWESCILNVEVPNITLRMPVFVIVWTAILYSSSSVLRSFIIQAMQKISEYRNGMGEFSLDALSHHFKVNSLDTEEQRAAFVKWQLGHGLPFLSTKTSFNPDTGDAVYLDISYMTRSSELMRIRSVLGDFKAPSYYRHYHTTSNKLGSSSTILMTFLWLLLLLPLFL